MIVTITEAAEVNACIHKFSMTAALDNMSRFGSQLCLAPCEAGLLDHAHGELGALVAAAKMDMETHCSADTVTALRQSLKGVKMSMAAGSSGGREVDGHLREAAERFEAEGVEDPAFTVAPISWRRGDRETTRPHEALVMQSQIDALPDGVRGDERKAIKAILEKRYRSSVHRMKYRRLVDGYIPGPIHEHVAQHDRYFAGIMGRPEPETPTDERQILQDMRHAARMRMMHMGDPRHAGRHVITPWNGDREGRA